MEKGVVPNVSNLNKVQYVLTEPYPVVGCLYEVRQDLWVVYTLGAEFVCQLSERVTKTTALKDESHVRNTAGHPPFPCRFEAGAIKSTSNRRRKHRK